MTEVAAREQQVAIASESLPQPEDWMSQSGQRHRRLLAERLKRQREFIGLLHRTGEDWVIISGFEHRHNFYGFVASGPVIPSGYWPHILMTFPKTEWRRKYSDSGGPRMEPKPKRKD